MYREGGHFDQAARLAEEMGDLAEASRLYLKTGDLKAAGEVELRLENRERAAWMFSRSGQHLRAAEIFDALDHYEAAAEQYEKAAHLEKAALLYVKADKPVAAAGLFQRLIDETPCEGHGSFIAESVKATLLKYHRYCGELWVRAGQPERAASCFEAALLPEPAAAAWRQAGQVERAADIYLRLQKPDEACAVLREAGKDLSSLSPAIQAEILLKQNRHREAAEVLERAGNRFRAAEAWKEAGESDRAARLFEAEGEFDQAAGLHMLAGNHAEAARIFETARNFKQAAALYRRAGMAPQAAAVLMKAGDPVAAARIHYESRDFDACIRALQKVRADSPEHRKASFLLGRIFAEQGLHTLALDKFIAAIDGEDVGEETVLIYYSLALAHEATLRPREALRIYHKILAFDYGYKDSLARIRAIESQPLATLGARGASRNQPRESGWAEPDRYIIEGSLGVGKIGEVFRARDTALGRAVAIRRLREGPREAGRSDRFLKEAAKASRLSHPGIITVYDTGADGEGRFIVTALAEGVTLRSLLDRKIRFEVGRIIALGRQIFEALEHAHTRNVLHRNLRAENIYVTDDDRVSLADFGLAVRLSDYTTEELSSGREIRYIPPEVLLKDRIDARSDIYSAGIVLYEMATGHTPFQGSEIGHQQVRAPVPLPGPGERPIPDFLKDIILRCLEKDKEQRYRDTRAVLEDLKLKEVVPGMVVADRYEVLAEIGRGGMGSVYRARDIELDETVALKFLSGEVSPEMVTRFIQEIKVARSVVHPNVVRVFTLEKWRDFRFIVMEYIDGVPLARWLKRSPAPLCPDRLRLGVQMAEAIDAAHRVGIIHRDIKPDNILITSARDAKVLDFGIARPEGKVSNLTATGTVLGSPRYMSPEQIQSRSLDRRSDIYSLGAVLYYLFTGIEPFDGKDVRETLFKHLHGALKAPHEVDPAIPLPVSMAVLKALESDPDQRFASSADLANALSGVQDASVA